MIIAIFDENADNILLSLVEKVKGYWQHVSNDFRSLSVVYRILEACPATEAAAERFFSYEKVVHSDLRNSSRNSFHIKKGKASHFLHLRSYQTPAGIFLATQVDG